MLASKAGFEARTLSSAKSYHSSTVRTDFHSRVKGGRLTCSNVLSLFQRLRPVHDIKGEDLNPFRYVLVVQICLLQRCCIIPSMLVAHSGKLASKSVEAFEGRISRQNCIGAHGCPGHKFWKFQKLHFA